MDPPAKKERSQKVTVTKDGPYIVTGGLPLAKEIIVFDENEGCPIAWAPGNRYPDKESYALCRCGESAQKPFCDGTHAKAGFDGTETASRKLPVPAETIEGKDVVLQDLQMQCARARFCQQGRGIWQIASSQKDRNGRTRAETIVGQCPSGKLVLRDRATEAAIEPHFEPSISLIEDPNKHVSGGVWLKGDIPIESADGTAYETRNRVTLCRCGRSGNKPFCDGTHIDSGFNDGDESLQQ